MTSRTIDAFPPSYRKPKDKIPKYRCDTCGNYECRKRFGVLCWTHCPNWEPDPFVFSQEGIRVKPREGDSK